MAFYKKNDKPATIYPLYLYNRGNKFLYKPHTNRHKKNAKIFTLKNINWGKKAIVHICSMRYCVSRK